MTECSKNGAHNQAPRQILFPFFQPLRLTLDFNGGQPPSDPVLGGGLFPVFPLGFAAPDLPPFAENISFTVKGKIFRMDSR